MKKGAKLVTCFVYYEKIYIKHKMLGIMIKKEVFFILIIFLIAIYGCAQQSLQNEKIIQPQQQTQEKQPPPECVDKKATDINLPESCKNWFSRQNSQEPSVGQESGNKCPDSVCDGVELKEGFCPQDCKGVEGWQDRQPAQEQQILPQEQQAPSEKEISVKALQSSYKIISSKPSGWFKTGQDADIMLSGVGFDNSGGPLQFNHPGGLATDGQRLIMADRFNNRILIWNSLPNSNTAPDMVLGQKDFISNSPGKGLDGMNWPVAVATDGNRLVVADTYNDRLLIWNSFPSNNGQAADIEVKDAGRGPSVNPKRVMEWPWAVWTDGEKLAATATRSATIIIWNSFPTKSNQPADISIVLPESFGTPRTIGSDGKHLVIGDHNIRVKGKDGLGNFFWKNFPDKVNQPYDFIISTAEEAPKNPSGQSMKRRGDIFWGPTFTPDGKLIALGERLHIWNTFPENENDLPDVSVGAPGPRMPGYRLVGGDGSGLVYTGNKIYISLYNGNKIVGYDTIPQNKDQKPDFAIGSPDIDTNTLDSVGFITNPVIETDGKSLFVSSDFDSKLSVWKSLPDEDGAKPDFIYDLDMAPWDSELFNNKLILAGRDKVHIWNNLPLNGELPDIKFERNIGSVTFYEIRGVAMDDKYFYLADANKIYVWEGVPEKNTNPNFILDALGATRLSSDGKYLVVAATEAPSEEMIKIYKLDGLSANSKPILIQSVTLNLPQAVLASDGHLFIADTGNNRVMVWNSIDDAVAGKKPDIVLGEEDLNDLVPEIGRDKLFWPASMAFDGSYLWVGEFKFSGRILRFGVGK